MNGTAGTRETPAKYSPQGNKRMILRGYHARMTTFRLSLLSRARLGGVHPDLVRVVERAIQITPVDFRVQEGLRDRATQAALFRDGASKTLNSRHLTGHAVDLVALVEGKHRWDWPLYHRIADAMLTAARELAIPLTWGGHWRTFPDGPHFELPRDRYP